jgi:hypothetical protein
MTVFVSDTFTDTNGTLLQDHTPEIGGNWIRRTGSQNFDIQSNTARVTVAKIAIHAYTNDTTAGAADYDVQSDVTVTASGNAWGVGLVGRLTDAGNYYFAIFGPSGTARLEIRKRVSDSETILDFVAEDIGDGTFEFKFEITDSSKKLYIDSVEKVSTADNELTANGQAGLWAQNQPTDYSWDNFLAETTSAPVATNAIMQPMHTWWDKS